MTAGRLLERGRAAPGDQDRAGRRYVADVLPAVTLFGLGLSATVAPLTATVLASADVRHAGVASGVNNAVARAAGLLAVAGLPAGRGADRRGLPRAAYLLRAGSGPPWCICAGLLAPGPCCPR